MLDIRFIAVFGNYGTRFAYSMLGNIYKLQRGSKMGELKKVTLSNGRTYYIDFRLEQLRDVENPHDFISFEDFEVNAMQDITDDWERFHRAIEATDNITKF